MNKRIRELAEQAGIKYAVAVGGEAYYEEIPDPKDLEKFAELIVRECASVIEKNHPEFTCKEDADNLYRKAGRMDAIDEIREHFGVEE